MTTKSKRFLRVIDSIRSRNTASPQAGATAKSVIEIEESLKCEHFQVGKIATHGFPCQPTCLAFDPVQRILAVGTKSGAVRIFGRVGVDYSITHPSSASVVKILFLVNEGGLVTICSDDVVHLWNIRQKVPEIVHSLQFKREHLTCGHLPMGSSWLYLGTDKGNVNFVNVQRFTTSGYVINWNKAMDLSQSAHPGRVIQIAENPQESNKILIGYSSGLIVLWDLRTKASECRFKYSENLYGVSWHWDGKTFLSCHNYGLIANWSCRQPQRPLSVSCPHAGGECVPDDSVCYDPIHNVTWLPNKNGDPFIIFSGGGRIPGAQVTADGPQTDDSIFDLTDADSSLLSTYYSLTVKQGKKLVVLQLDHRLVQFTPLCSSPYTSEAMDPYAVAVLLQDDLVVIDLLSPNYPTFENPYPMDLHSSTVTFCLYVSGCAPELIGDLYAIGNRHTRNANNTTSASDSDVFSSREWPITGGEWNMSDDAYPELILTGHADGSVRFWDASEVTLSSLYKFRSSKMYDIASKPIASNPDETGTLEEQKDLNLNFSSILLATESDPFAIKLMHFCPDSRLLVIAGSTHACVLKFSRKDQSFNTKVLDLNIAYECSDDLSLGAGDTFVDEQQVNTTSYNNSSTNLNLGTILKDNGQKLPHKSTGSASSYLSVSAAEKEIHVLIPIRHGYLPWSPGYQPLLVCRLRVPCPNFDSVQVLNPELNVMNPSSSHSITAVSLNSAFKLLAIGTESGISLVDIVRRCCLLSVSSADLLGSEMSSRVANRSSGRVNTPLNDTKSNELMVPNAHSEHNRQRRHSYVRRNSKSRRRASDHRKAFTRSISCEADAVQRGDGSISSSVSSNNENDLHFLIMDLTGDLECTTVEKNSWLKRVFTRHRNVQQVSSTVDVLTKNAILTNSVDFLSMISPLTASFVLACRSTPHRLQSQNVQQNTSSEKCSDPQQLSKSCSLSVSTGSLDHLNSQEIVKLITFTESCMPKQATAGVMGSFDSNSLQMWIGTSRGCVVSLNLKLPTSGVTHPNQQLVTAGALYRLHNDIVTIGFLDLNGDQFQIPSQRWEEDLYSSSKSELMKQSSAVSSTTGSGSSHEISIEGDYPLSSTLRRLGPSGVPSSHKHKEMLSKQNTVTTSTTSTSSSGHSSTVIHSPTTTGSTVQPVFVLGTDSPTGAKGLTEMDQQLVVLCSEKQARVIALPSQTCLYKAKITETSQVIRASVQRLRPPGSGPGGASCFLACYLANGRFVALSLPSLRLLLDQDYLSPTECVLNTFTFGQYGQVVYFKSPTELFKVTWSAEYCANLKDRQGELFVPANMPELPKKGFFKNLLSATMPTSVDRDELFGEATSGKAVPGTTALLPNARMEKLSSQSGSATSDIARARNAAIERGERLQLLDLQTQEMADQAKSFGRNAALLAAKYEKKDKRWGWPL